MIGHITMNMFVFRENKIIHIKVVKANLKAEQEKLHCHKQNPKGGMF